MTLVAPTAGATVSGRAVVLKATANWSERSWINFYVDGFSNHIEYGPNGYECTANVQCTVSATWDASTYSGPYTVTAQLVDYDNIPIPGGLATAEVTVSNPVPQVTITSPTAGANVTGTAVVLKARATTDPSLSITPGWIDFYIDGAWDWVGYSSNGCDASPCTVTAAWDASNYSAGQHVVMARLTTSPDGKTVDSALVTVSVTPTAVVVVPPPPPAPVVVRSATFISFAPLRAVRSGGWAQVSGRVLVSGSGAAAPGQAVGLTMTPVVGAASAVTVTTDANGVFSGRFLTAVNGVVSASTPGSASYLASSASVSVAALAAPTCKLTTKSVRVRAKVTGSCTVPSLPKSTAVTVQYQLKGRWLTAVSMRSKTAKIAFKTSFKKKGSYPLRVVFGANRLFAATASPSMLVRVR
jgi:hypothetical protein